MSEPDDDLDKRIASARERAGLTKKVEEKQSGSVSQAAGMAVRYGAEFASAIIVSVLIGIAIDHFFGTTPWGLLILMAFGLAAGVLGVIRAYKELSAPADAGADEAGKT